MLWLLKPYFFVLWDFYTHCSYWTGLVSEFCICAVVKKSNITAGNCEISHVTALDSHLPWKQTQLSSHVCQQEGGGEAGIEAGESFFFRKEEGQLFWETKTTQQLEEFFSLCSVIREVCRQAVIAANSRAVQMDER